jgi:hypothetical protein
MNRHTLALLRLRATIALGASLLAFAVHAAEMYRWIDERGVTNISDSVPDKYKAIAQRVDTTQFDAEEARRRESARRAAVPASGAASAASVAASASAATPGALSASAAAANGDDCPTLQRRFRDAQKCFGPAVRTINGNVNSARSPECPNVVDPEPKCGPDPLLK